MFILSQSFRIRIEVAPETCFWLGLPLCSELYQHKPSPALSLPQTVDKASDGLISSRLFYGARHCDMGELQTSIKFFPEQPHETEEGEMRKSSVALRAHLCCKPGPNFKLGTRKTRNCDGLQAK